MLSALTSLALLGTPVAVLAAATTDLPDWAKYGLLGLVVIALATGQLLVPAYIYKAEKGRAEAAERRERELRDGIAISTAEGLKETRDILNRVSGFLEAKRE